jgi:hypothetical protein
LLDGAVKASNSIFDADRRIQIADFNMIPDLVSRMIVDAQLPDSDFSASFIRILE